MDEWTDDPDAGCRRPVSSDSSDGLSIPAS